MVRRALLLAVLAAVAAVPTASAQDGIPVTSQLVLSKCGTCHRPDDQMRMSRISYRRSTPENWERTIKRMIQLNHLALEPADARAILKYLSDNHGLAPEEAKPVTFETEHRLDPYTYAADKETAVVCSSCHSVGRPMSDRRTKAEWEGVLSMHRGYYPLVDNQPMNDGQGFRRSRAVEGNADKRQPMERIVEHLSKAFPLNTAAWTDWTAARQTPALAGKWGLTGYVAGKGPIFGVMTVTADAKEADTFITEAKYTFARTGETMTRKGRSIVYSGFQWRGRSAIAAPEAETWREVMLVDRAQREMSGRWFGGAYDELGMEVSLTRIGTDPLLFGSSAAALKTSTDVPTLRLYGVNFPARVTPAQINLGRGVTVTSVVSSTPDLITVAVQVAGDAVPGPRDLSVAGAYRPAALIVYDKVDTIRVLPQAGLARVGGAVFPKQYQQFEAVAFSNGPDKLPDTADDWNLGALGAAWSMEEYTATFDDDDVQFVGSIDKAGFFTPNVDGPNPKRSSNPAQQGRNNIGDVWIVANVAADPALGIKAPIKSRAQLVVAPPVYVNWLASSSGQ